MNTNIVDINKRTDKLSKSISITNVDRGANNLSINSDIADGNRKADNTNTGII